MLKESIKHKRPQDVWKRCEGVKTGFEKNYCFQTFLKYRSKSAFTSKIRSGVSSLTWLN